MLLNYHPTSTTDRIELGPHQSLYVPTIHKALKDREHLELALLVVLRGLLPEPAGADVYYVDLGDRHGLAMVPRYD